MSKQNIQDPQVLTLATSQAAHFADEFVGEPVAVLELRIKSTSPAGQKAQASYSLGRNQALTRGKGGVPRHLSKTELNDPDAGRGETSAQLLARRLR